MIQRQKPNLTLSYGVSVQIFVMKRLKVLMSAAYGLFACPKAEEFKSPSERCSFDRP